MKIIFKNSQIALLLAIFLFSLLNVAHAQEIPNGDGDLLWKVPVTKNLGTSVAIHPVNSNILINEDRNNLIYEFDVNNGNLIRTITCDSNSRVNSIHFSQDGTNLLIELWGKSETQIIDYNSGTKLKSCKYILYNLQTYPNNSEILGLHYLSDTEQYIERYDYINNKVVKRLNLYDLENGSKNVGISAIALSPDGTQFAVSYKYFNSYYIKIFDANSFELIKSVPYSWTDIIENLEFSSKNKYLSVSSNVNILADVINLESNQKFSFWPKHMVKFSADEKYWIIEAWYTRPIIDIYNANTYNKVFIFNTDGGLTIFKDNKLFVINGFYLSLYSPNWHFVGVDEPKEPQATIFPNPASDYIEVNVGANGHLPLQEIRIYDVFGKCVLSVETQCITSLQKIDVSTLPAGVYFVRIGNEIPAKFIKI